MLSIAGRCISPRLVIFDKDGTLLAFDAIWKTWYALLVDALGAEIPLDHARQRALAGVLGADPQTGEWDPFGPLTLASTSEVRLLMAGMIYQHCGKSWPEALKLVGRVDAAARASLEESDLAQPIGPLKSFLEKLRGAGHLLAIATADDRGATEETLERLEIASLLCAYVCGDDGIPPKPAPDMVRTICAQVGVPAHEAIVVGDTIFDMEMGRAAGCSHVVAVTSGALSREHLAPYADMVIPDIHAIEIIPSEEAL